MENKHNTIEINKVTKHFKQGSETIEALKETTFSATPGQFIAIIGPSGSGKSTFLTILGGLQTPSTGEVYLGGKRLDKASLKELSAIRFQKLGFILQSSSLVPFLTVKDQLILHDKVAGTQSDLSRAEEILTLLGVAHLSKKYPSELSGGERQRVAIAAALYHDPEVILADEPTAALDSNRAFEIVELLRDITHKSQKTTIMVTHDQRLIEYCDAVYVMHDGKLEQQK